VPHLDSLLQPDYLSHHSTPGGSTALAGVVFSVFLSLLEFEADFAIRGQHCYTFYVKSQQAVN
jgi:hypothetical protein